jgi:hypothetical protein
MLISRAGSGMIENGTKKRGRGKREEGRGKGNKIEYMSLYHHHYY